MTTDSRNSGPQFAANLLFRSSRNGQFAETNLWEEVIVLINAESEADAYITANAMGRSRESYYITSDGVEVAWLFYRVERVFGLMDLPLQHGSEVFSRHLRDLEVQSILKPFDEY
ncbi:MAG: DUF4288 domain-containing protein [Acidovorax sp.]|nr:DUF4288 domain-containing protein [Acidovorax sp.]